MDEFEYRGDKKEPKKKFDFKKRKDNTVKSLFEIEHFLRDFKQVAKGIKFYKVFNGDFWDGVKRHLFFSKRCLLISSPELPKIVLFNSSKSIFKINFSIFKFFIFLSID